MIQLFFSYTTVSFLLLNSVSFKEKKGETNEHS
jgi:hypothetical protein